MSEVWPDFEDVYKLTEPLLIKYEGFKSKPYLCPAGKPTIGYGTRDYPSGKGVTLNDSEISEETARLYLEENLRKTYLRLQRSGILSRIPTKNQTAALLSFIYNVGMGVKNDIKGDFADSTLVDLFNTGDIVGASKQFLYWDKIHNPDGSVSESKGLLARRQDEAQLFLRK